MLEAGGPERRDGAMMLRAGFRRVRTRQISPYLSRAASVPEKAHSRRDERIARAFPSFEARDPIPSW